MESAKKVIVTIRNNWKKSIFFSGVAAWGVSFGIEKYNEAVLRELYSHEAKKYGHETLKLGRQPKKLLVFYNPAAKGGKARKLFEKNAAPLLHLAGFEVTVVKTEYTGQAKQYMEVLENGSTDGIVVAGGNGTLAEVITGMLRRPDQAKLSQLPLAFIPLGSTNTVAEWLYHRGESAVRWQLEAAMAVVKGFLTSVDVMAIKGSEGKTIYALSDFQWGVYEEANQLIPKYWYMGPLKKLYAYFKQTLAVWPPTQSAEMSYVLPCDGCSACMPPPPPRPRWRWWHLFFRPAPPAPVKDYTGIVNAECGAIHAQPVSTMQLSVSTTNDRFSDKERPHKLTVSTTAADMGKMDFIKKSWQGDTANNMPDSAGGQLDVRSLNLDPQLTEGSIKWFTIDNERFEAMPVEIELLKNKLTFNCSPDTSVPFIR